MEVSNRALIVLGAILIGLGALFLALNLLPNWSIALAWPVIFFFVAALFFIPPFVLPSQRQWISALFIPGAILLMLGLIFFYQTATGEWETWAYAWLLLVAAVGVGLMLAGWYGRWGRPVVTVGMWMLLVNLALFSLFGALFSERLRVVAPVLLTLSGVLLLVRSLARR